MFFSKNPRKQPDAKVLNVQNNFKYIDSVMKPVSKVIAKRTLCLHIKHFFAFCTKGDFLAIKFEPEMLDGQS